MKMRTALASEHLHVRPGVPTLLDVEVTNTADVIDGVTAEFEGLDPTWVQLVSPVISLFPESTSTLTARLDLPPNCIAGDYLITMHVFSTIDPDRRTTSQFWLTVDPVPGLAVQLRPSLITGGSKAEFTALIANPGNVALQVSLKVEEDTSEVTCAAEPPVVLVEPGHTERVAILAKGPRPWFGSPVARSLVITATAPDVEVVELATFNQKPRVPRGVLTILILAGIIALWATIFMLIITTLRSGSAPTKAVATSFNEGGATDVALLAVAGSASGSVTAKTTGEGLARITVEARRVAPDGSSELIASAATGDDGSFVLETLLPGSYKFRFTADGFKEIWFPAATSEGDAEMVKVASKGAAEGVDVVIEGNPGQFLGQILAPESAGPVTIKVTATLKVETAAGAADTGSATTGSATTVGATTTTTAPPAPPEFTATTDGPLDLSGLPSPGTYHFRIESPGFDPLEFDETLKGGETKVLNTVRLGAALGAISGRVTDGNGVPLGGVTVTVSSGEFVKEVTTPTEGNIGAYSIDGLETPNTYVITFAADGYATVTRALDLAAGAVQGGVDARLTGGAGTVAGTVTALDGTPLGGVKITVAGGLFTAESETLTTGTPGAYVVAGIPTPGTYTVTFAADGYQSETRSVSFSGPGQIGGIDGVLHPATGSITGTVSLAGTPSDGVEIELSSGNEPKITQSASDPAGAYSFTGVEPGTYTLTFRRSGFTTQVLLVEVVVGDVVSRNVNLT